MQNITQSEYNKEIQSLAKEIWDDALEQANNDREDAHDLIYDLTHEYVDGHQWIIYSAYNQSVTECSDNPDAYQDIYDDTGLGQLVAEGGVSQLYTTMAYWAMHVDVSNAVYGLAEEEFYNEQFSR